MKIDKIRTKEEYSRVMMKIETYIQKSTKLGGIEKLSKKEAEELANLALIAEEFEDSIPLMPVKV